MQINRMKKIVSLIFLFVWMGIIFMFSSQEADESENISRNIVTKFIISHYDGYNEMSVEKQAEFVDTLDFVVRKTAHATEYAILACLFMNVLISFDIHKKRSILICFIISILSVAIYASSDEFHQIFVKGRSGNIKDVCIDTLGGTIGCLILLLIYKISNKVKKRRYKIKKPHLK